ncbi:hypothetical protein IWW57_003709 [Coemansia sp. S610]|nr:hypothetical protein IWW57_003709 [Coemansia sp. S610]
MPPAYAAVIEAEIGQFYPIIPEKQFSSIPPPDSRPSSALSIASDCVVFTGRLPGANGFGAHMDSSAPSIQEPPPRLVQNPVPRKPKARWMPNESIVDNMEYQADCIAMIQEIWWNC